MHWLNTIAVLQQLFAHFFWYLLGNFWPHFMITEFLIPNHTIKYFEITNVIYKYEALSSECSHVLVQMSCMHLLCTQVAMCASSKIKITLICSSQPMPSTHTYHKNIFCCHKLHCFHPLLRASINWWPNFGNPASKYWMWRNDSEFWKHVLLWWWRWKSFDLISKVLNDPGEVQLRCWRSFSVGSTFTK